MVTGQEDDSVVTSTTSPPSQPFQATVQRALENEEVMFLNMLQRSHTPVLTSRVCVCVYCEAHLLLPCSCRPPSLHAEA